MPRVGFQESDDGYIFIGINVLETEEEVQDFHQSLTEAWQELLRQREIRFGVSLVEGQV